MEEDIELGREFIEFIDEMNVGNSEYEPYTGEFRRE